MSASRSPQEALSVPSLSHRTCSDCRESVIAGDIPPVSRCHLLFFLPCSLPCVVSPRLARPCLARPRLAKPCLARPCLALPWPRGGRAPVIRTALSCRCSLLSCPRNTPQAHSL